MSEGVSVTYTYHPNTAEVTILVEKNGSGQILITPALPQFSHGQWEVTFHLVAGTGITHLKFDESNGIVIDTKPPQLAIDSSFFEDDRNWKMKLTNQVDSANEATYTINGTADDIPFVGDFTRFSHDPTIAVTTDPIGG